MTEDEFWAIVDDVSARSGGDPEVKESLLTERLNALDAGSVAAFAGHLDAKMGGAYTWPLWGAAYIIHGGCSDDGFMDFRSCVIFLGRKAFEAALENPDSLASLDDDVLGDTGHEGLLYVAGRIYEAKTGGDLPRGNPHPPEPSGQDWDEDDETSLSALCPELWKRFGVLPPHDFS